MAKAKTSTVATSEIVSRLSEQFEQIPKKITKELVVAFLSAVEDQIASENKVRLDKIGILTVKARAARKGRNPQTGAEIMIPASKKISFRASKSLKERIGMASKKAKAAKKK